jgi:cytochrome P450 family 4
MLDTLLKAEQNGEIDDEGIREEVDTFMFAGHDTTSVAITFTLFELAQHQDVQEKILEELNEAKASSSSGEITMNDVNNMRYLDCVVKESLRLHTPVPIISRKLTEDLDMSKI